MDVDPMAASTMQFRGKVESKLVETIGVFASLGGFSPDSVDAPVAGMVISTIFFDGTTCGRLAGAQLSGAHFPSMRRRIGVTPGRRRPGSPRSTPGRQDGPQVPKMPG